MNAKEYQEYMQKNHSKKKRNKFGAKKTMYNGVSYDSKGEAKYAYTLDVRKRLGEVKHWERQIPIKLIVNDTLITVYRIDFKVIFPDGSIEYHEFKGHETPDWKLKWKLALVLYPDRKFVLVKNI
jgi:hypothetical protein